MIRIPFYDYENIETFLEVLNRTRKKRYKYI